jgi:hypothetical protein
MISEESHVTNLNDILLLARPHHNNLKAQTSRHDISIALRATVKPFGVEFALSAV